MPDQPIRGKFSKIPVPLLDRGRSRFQRFTKEFQALDQQPPHGRLLDFGCGAGGFLLAAIEAGLDAMGVDTEMERYQQFQLLAPDTVLNRMIVYDGGLLPFDSASFGIVYSWFVFEHVTNPNLSTREIARVLKPGGILYIYADDARNNWDGHVNIPIPAFMPRAFTQSYLEVFELEDRTAFINNSVVYITAPMITAVLQTLDCDILYENSAPTGRTIPGGSNISSNAEAKSVANTAKQLFEQGLITSPTENLHIVARKRSTGQQKALSAKRLR